MSKKSFAALYAKLEPTPAYQAEKLSVAFLAELNAFMQTHAISNAELARRAGVSPAYVTRWNPGVRFTPGQKVALEVRAPVKRGKPKAKPKPRVYKKAGR